MAKKTTVKRDELIQACEDLGMESEEMAELLEELNLEPLARPAILQFSFDVTTSNLLHTQGLLEKKFEELGLEASFYDSWYD